MRLAKQTHVSPLNSPIRVSYLQPNCGFVTEWPKISKICCISPALNRRRLFTNIAGLTAWGPNAQKLPTLGGHRAQNNKRVGGSPNGNSCLS